LEDDLSNDCNLVFKMNPKVNRTSNFVLVLGLGRTCGGFLRTLLFVCACIHTQNHLLILMMCMAYIHLGCQMQHTLCVCVCVCERERERERERESARTVVEAKFVIVIESFVLTGLGKQNS
jgi:hypothetical protein